MLLHSYGRNAKKPQVTDTTMAVAAAQKSREMFAIKKSYSIEVTELVSPPPLPFFPSRNHPIGISHFLQLTCSNKLSRSANETNTKIISIYLPYRDAVSDFVIFFPRKTRLFRGQSRRRSGGGEWGEETHVKNVTENAATETCKSTGFEPTTDCRCSVGQGTLTDTATIA